MAAINFPDTPTTGQVFTVGDRSWIYNGTVWESNSTRDYNRTVSDTAPGSPVVGDEWFNSSTGRLYTYYDGYWVEIGTSVAGETGVVFSATEPSSTAVLWADTDDTAEPVAVPSGGAAGQILQKSTSGDYDTAWANVPSHNYIINGAFEINQRGLTSTSTQGQYVADRFWINFSGATGTCSRVAFAKGELVVDGFGEPSEFIRVQSTVADNNTSLGYIHEGVTDFSGQTITVSAYARSADATSLAFELQRTTVGSTVNFGAISFTPTSTWGRYSATFTVPDLTGLTVDGNSQFRLFLVNKNTETFTADWWGVQIEIGSVATPFKRNALSLQGELAACKRYYWRRPFTNAQPVCTSAAFNTTILMGELHYSEMRTVPTILTSGTFASLPNGTAVTLGNIIAGTTSARFDATGSGYVANNAYQIRSTSNTSYIDFNAEF